MDCMDTMIKYILYIFNLIFVVCGILLIVLGSIMLSDMGTFRSFSQIVNTDAIPIIIIVFGGVIFIISFFGCCGAVREINCCMMIYGLFMFVLLCLEIALVVWIFVKQNDFLNSIGSVVDKAFEENPTANGSPMEALQLSFSCCGVNGASDYTSANEAVPNSCCGIANSGTNQCPATNYLNKPGCKKSFVDFWSSNMDIIRYAGIGVAIVELVAFTFACCLANGIRKSSDNNV